MVNNRIIAIGDIHGCIDNLRRLVAKISPVESDFFVFLGDYIDRGPDTPSMPKVKVYRYEGYDIKTDQTINHGRFATMKYINERKLTPLLKDILEVFESDLDPEGRYIDRK